MLGEIIKDINIISKIKILITIISIIPIIGIIIIITERDKRRIKIIGLIVTIINIIIYIIIYIIKNNKEEIIGIDNISIVMIGVTVIIMPLTIIKEEGRKGYIIIMMVLEWLLIEVFIELNIIKFYIIFELSIIPIYILIGRYGNRERKIYAAYKIMIMTIIGSLLMLIGIILIYSSILNTTYEIIRIKRITEEREKIIFILLLITFMIKTPLIPLHKWLPEAHSEAEIGGSVVLAGIVLKIAGYGLIRYSIGILPLGAIYNIPLVLGIGVISIIKGTLITIREIDMKRIIAYTSISHMGIVIIGIISMKIEGIIGSIILMIGHGIVSSSWFILVTIIYIQYKSRIIKYYRGLIERMPVFGFLYFLIILGNIGMPLTINFIGELLSYIGGIEINIMVTIIGTISIIINGGYTIYIYNKKILGEASINRGEDINRKGGMEIIPMIILIYILGIIPYIIIGELERSVSEIIYTIKLNIV